MTLIAYIRCRDGCILFSDRQASELSGHSQENKKTFVSERKDFAIVGAGYGFDVVSIFSVLTHDVTVVGSNVVERLRQAIQDYCERSGTYSNPDVRVKALLIARQNKGLVPYEVRIHGSRFYINPISTIHRCCGIDAARIIADYFLKKIKLDELPWEEATQYAIATMKEVGKEVDGVERLEEFGFDITVMLDNGAVYESVNYGQNSADLQHNFRILSDVSSDFTKTHEPTEES